MDIPAWLKSLGLEQYAEAFTAQHIDAASLPSLTAEDLREIGVASVGHRRRLLDAIAALRKDPPAPPPKPAEPAGERRPVTVLFADIAGFTALSNEIGAEAIHDMLGAFFARADDIVARHGGRIDKHIGDCVMAVFGAPVARADDSLRAVRAALAIREGMQDVSRTAGRTLAAHVGVASGQVVASRMGSARHSEYTVVGESVNLAARLTAAAADGEVLVDEAVYRGLHGRIAATPKEPLALKGFAEPVRAWSVTALLADDAAATPFFGRGAELSLFEAGLRACLSAGGGTGIAIRGEAGIGKSRLLKECVRRSRDLGFTAHVAAALDFGGEQGRDPQRQIAASLLGLAADATPEDRRAALTAALAAGPFEPAASPFLEDLLNLPLTPASRSLMDAMEHARRAAGRHEALARLAVLAGRRGPALIVLEDAHWADADTLRALARLIREAARAGLVVAFSTRPEGDPSGTPWRIELQGAPLITIDLGPLRERDCSDLAEAMIGARSAFVGRCLERAAGNPLFLEQLLRHAAGQSGDALPATVQSSVLARVDRLGDADKTAMRAAAALGQRFALAALRAVLERPDYDPAPLVANFLMRPEGDDYAFAHALIRDGVYLSLLQADRRELHRRAAGWYAERDAILHAEHLDRAEAPGAASAYGAAARQELAAYRYENALRLAERGRDLAAGDAAAELECLVGEILEALGRTGDMLEAFRRAENLAAGPVARARAWIGQADGLRVADKIDEALALLDRAESPLREAGRGVDLARLHHLRGNLWFPKGNVEACRAAHTAALESAKRAGSAEWMARALGGLGDAEYARARLISAHARFGECVDLARRHGFGRIEVANRNMLIICRIFDGPVHGMGEEAEAAAAAAAAVGHYRAEIIARHAAMMVALWSGDLAAVAREFALADASARRIGAKRFEAENYAFLAEAERQAGDIASARRRLEKSLAMCRETGIAYIGPIVLGYVALAWCDSPVERQAALAEGEALLAAGGLAHNVLFFFSAALEVALRIGDWAAAERYAEIMERRFAAEPLRFVDMLTQRGRALAALGRGEAGAAERWRAASQKVRELGYSIYASANKASAL